MVDVKDPGATTGSDVERWEAGPVRTHGWQGDPPRDDDEARRRLLAVTRACLAEGVAATPTEVAGRLGVTRQTVYRYFPGRDALLDAAAAEAITDLVATLVPHVRDHLARTGGDAGDAVVEVVAHVYEHLRGDPALQRLVSPGRLGTTLPGFTAPSAITLGVELLEGFGVDWDDLGLDASWRGELVEHLLRVLQSLVLDPGERDAVALRAYLHRWVAPAVRTAGSGRLAGAGQ